MVAVIVVGFTTLTFVAGMPPTVTVAPGSKSIPVRVDATPPPCGPEGGSIEERMRCENSEVLPDGSMAIAVTGCPAGRTKGTSVAKAALPEPSVATGSEPRYVSPWRASCGRRRHPPEYRSTVNAVDAELFNRPSMCVVDAPATTLVMIG